MSLILLDYGKQNPFGETIGRPRNLAWPVNAYRVTLPNISDDSERLNAFERVILKLIDSGAPDAKAMAKEICIPEDLVKCVLLRLQDKSYIDEYNRIIKQRGDDAEKEQSPASFVTALLFRELATGKILPYLHFLGNDNPLKKKEREESNYFRKIRWDNVYKDKPAAPPDVISVLRAMQKRSMAFGRSTPLPPVRLIVIAEEPELHYLDCPIAIRKREEEFRIANPFSDGYSLLLEASFSCLLEKDAGLGDWLMNWRRNLSGTGQSKQATAHEEPYDNDINRALYPKLVDNLNSHKRKFEQYRSIEQLHAVIEWALFYSCARRPYNSAVQQLRLTKQSEHPALLKKAAEDISLELPQIDLLPVTEDKLGDFLYGKAEWGTVLSLSLLMAAGDASHPLRRFASRHRDFIMRLFSIKKNRDESAHGADKTRRRDVELPEETFVREVISTLMPSFLFSDTPAAVNRDDVADLLLDSRTSIQYEFGFALFNRLGTNLQDRLIAAERFWLPCNDGDDALVFARDIYAALQNAFRRSLSGVLPPDIDDSEYVATAQKNAEQCGLGELPEPLLKVSRSALRETLQGNDKSLRSCVVAFLLVSAADVLTAIAQAHPRFLADVEHVAARRAHGNEPLPLPKKEILKLRKAAFTSIKTLLEA